MTFDQPGGFIKTQMVQAHLSDSIGLGWTPKMFISHNVSGEADAAGLETTFWKTLLKNPLVKTLYNIKRFSKGSLLNFVT